MDDAWASFAAAAVAGDSRATEAVLMKVWSVLLLISLAVAGCGRAGGDGDAERPLLWAADAEGGLPYICRDENDPNRFVGFEVELAEALSQELG